MLCANVPSVCGHEVTFLKIENLRETENIEIGLNVKQSHYSDLFVGYGLLDYQKA